MSHKTGPRRNVVNGLHNKFYTCFHNSPALVSEGFAAAHGLQVELLDSIGAKREILRRLRALHKREMLLVRKALRPLEKDGCPTCPK